MFRLLSSLISFLMYWMFLYVESFLLMIVAIFYITQTNKTPNSTVQVVEPPKRVVIEEEICTRLDRCPTVKNVCFDWKLILG